MNSPDEENLSGQSARSSARGVRSQGNRRKHSGEDVINTAGRPDELGLRAAAKSITLVTSGWLNKTGIENGSHAHVHADPEWVPAAWDGAEQEPGSHWAREKAPVMN